MQAFDPKIVACMSPLVWRISGLNPGPMTLDGTNTYLVGSGTRRVLVDTGDGSSQYLQLLSDVLRALRAQIDHVLLTHWHADHTGGVGGVVQMCPSARVWKIPSCVQCPCPPYEHFPLSDGDIIETEGASIQTIAAPGHTDDHAVFTLREEGTYFTGDCLLGRGTTVFSCYGDYLTSLHRLRGKLPVRMYPAHGPVIEQGTDVIDQYIDHRNMRDEQILQHLSGVDAATAVQLVEALYADVSPRLHRAASLNVTHHLRNLRKKGVIEVLNPTEEEQEALASNEYTAFIAEGVLNEQVMGKLLPLRWARAGNPS